MLVSWHKKYAKQGLFVVGVTEMAPPVKEVKKVMRDRHITYPVTIDKGERIFKSYGLESHPTTILIDRNGKVAMVEVGFVRGDEKRIEAVLLSLLRGESASQAGKAGIP